MFSVSLFFASNLLTVKRPSWQPTCSRKILLISQPSHITSLPFPKNAKAHYYTAQDYTSLYPIKIFLIPESVSDLESEKTELESSFYYYVKSYHLSQNFSLL